MQSWYGNPGREESAALYAAVVATRTDKTAAEMARMGDGVSDDRVELAMRAVEENGHLRTASDAVAAAMFTQPVASQRPTSSSACCQSRKP